MVTMVAASYKSRSESAPQPVLILCADEAITEELIRHLAGRRYQPLVGRPNWSWQAAFEWARPVAAVVDRSHPAARSQSLADASDNLEIGLVVFGGSAAVRTDVEVIGGAVDAAIRRRSARAD